MKMAGVVSFAFFLGHVLATKQDSYDFLSSAPESRKQRSNLRRNVKQMERREDIGHKSAGLIQYKTGTSANAALSAEVAEAKMELARITKTAKAESANSMHLKAEVTKAVTLQYNLRSRLQQVSGETRANLAMLLKQLKVAKAAAQKSEALLQSEIQQESSNLNAAEKTELALRNQLASVEVSATTADRAAAAQNAKAAIQQETDRRAMAKLQAEVESTLKSSHKELADLNGKLAQMQQSAAKDQKKLREQVKAIQDAAVKERSQLDSRLKDLSRSAEKNQDDLESERFTEKLLLANVTSIKEEAELVAAQSRKERMGLLVQVSELQGQATNAQKRVISAEKTAKSVKEDAEAKSRDLARVADLQGNAREHRIAALLQETQVAHANLNAAANAAKLAQQKVADLQTLLARAAEQLRVAALESDSLKSARDAALKGQEAFQKMDMAAETTLNQTRQELASTENEVQSMKHELASHLNDASVLSAKCKSLQNQLAILQQGSATEQAKIKQQTHDSMISAAAKVHELEDQNDQLSNDLQKAKQELAIASAESSKAKDTLMQQTDASLKVTQRADSLQNTLNQIQKEADANNAHIEEFTRQATALREERDRSKAASLEHSAAQTELDAKVEALEAAKKSEESRIMQIKAEDKKLKTQMEGLSGEESRADELEEELANLRQSMQRKDTEESQMAKKLEMLRTLKDHYSADNQEIKKETVEWQRKAEDLEEKVKDAKRRLQKMAKQREKALLRAKQARSQEDEYFEENARLQQQDEALNTKLVEIGATSNRTEEENSFLQQKLDEMTNEQQREKDNSKAASQENQMELKEARQDLQESQRRNDDIKAEIQRMQAVLSDKERRALDLPPLKMVSAATPTVVASPVVAEISVPSQKPEAKQLRHEAKDALTNKAKALTQLPGEPTRPTDDAAATLESVTSTKAASPRSALQKLTDFFASPLPAAPPR